MYLGVEALQHGGELRPANHVRGDDQTLVACIGVLEADEVRGGDVADVGEGAEGLQWNESCG